MPLVQSNLIHDQPSHFPELDVAGTVLQAPFVDLFDGVSTDPGELAKVDELIQF